MPWWVHVHTEWSKRIKWGAKQGLFWKSLQNPKLLDMMSKSILTVPFFKYLRWHDRHSTEFTGTRYGLEYLLCLLHAFGYYVPPWSDSLYSGRAKVKSGGICWRLLSTIFKTSTPAENKWEVIINIGIGVYTDNFHKCWCFYLLLQDTSKCTCNWMIELRASKPMA
jgi:hypothetical protein